MPSQYFHPSISRVYAAGLSIFCNRERTGIALTLIIASERFNITNFRMIFQLIRSAIPNQDNRVLQGHQRSSLVMISNEVTVRSRVIGNDGPSKHFPTVAIANDIKVYKKTHQPSSEQFDDIEFIEPSLRKRSRQEWYTRSLTAWSCNVSTAPLRIETDSCWKSRSRCIRLRESSPASTRPTRAIAAADIDRFRRKLSQTRRDNVILACPSCTLKSGYDHWSVAKFKCLSAGFITNVILFSRFCYTKDIISKQWFLDRHGSIEPMRVGMVRQAQYGERTEKTLLSGLFKGGNSTISIQNFNGLVWKYFSITVI